MNIGKGSIHLNFYLKNVYKYAWVKRQQKHLL